jgi:hypothetical protein
MDRPVARRVRASFLLAALAGALTLGACGARPAGTPIPVTTPSPAPPTAAPATPGSSRIARLPGTDPGTGPGGAGGSTGAGNPGDPNGTVTSPPMQPGPVPGDGALHVKPVPGVKDARPASIDHISVAADGITLTVYWYGGVEECYALAEVRLERDSHGLLIISVMEGTRPGLPPNTACIDLAQLKATTVSLDGPLFQDGSQPHDL